ncbi:MAG TPA: FAD-dependent oxidoreductase, partial [Candidatus Nanopelagicales bacterium]|nr:FAD-dependent oxidoreductase [Candidatus Nanopelagicales bacterium]
LARAVAPSLHLSQEVVSILSRRDHVEMGVRSLRDGSTHHATFDHVINTIPPPAQRGIAHNFGPRKRWAMSGVRYAAATKVALLCRERFWERRYGIDAGAAYLGPLAKLAYFPNPEQYEEARSDPRGVLLGSYTVGRDAEALSGYGDEALVSLVRSEIATRYPEIEQPGMVEAHRVVHWQREAGFSGACSVMWPSYYDDLDSGSLASMFEELRRPEGRVHFAGEHCSSYRAWIEGAIVSSLQSVAAIGREVAQPMETVAAAVGAP